MSVLSSGLQDGVNVREPSLTLPKGEQMLDQLPDDKHSALLDFLTSRLKSGNQDRTSRLLRYSRIDKLISTWQKLSKEDAQRAAIEDNTGKQQAIPMNIPILAAHLEDSVSFFAEIFAPQGRDFYVLAPRDLSEPAKELAKKMNRDTKSRKYYKAICGCMRSLLKYNLGGLSVRYEEGSGVGQLAEGGNRIEAIDMYNYLYDPSIQELDRIPTEAEWAARISQKNRSWFLRRGLRKELARIDRLFDEARKKNVEMNQATFFKYAPSFVGLSEDGEDDRSGSRNAQGVDWESYGASLSTDTTVPIQGFELIEMYCWLSPEEFGLDVSAGEQAAGDDSQGLDKHGNSYSLWRFLIADTSQIVLAEKVSAETESEEIPHYFAFYTQDDMKGSQRSNMEMMRPFQRLISFLFNIIVAGARKNIWGLKGYDPQMFDLTKIQQGDVAGNIPSKVPGRDVRSGLMTLDSSSGTERVFEMLGAVREIMQSLYPAQALPAQIAGIDRAVKNQVSAVMQGVARRLHMTARLLDDDLLGPMRMQAYRNLAAFDSDGLDGLTEEEVGKILSSGMGQLNKEVLVADLRELIFALMQNPESAAQFDLPGLFTQLSRFMNSPVDLGEFVVQAAPPAGPTQADPAANGGEVAPGMMGV